MYATPTITALDLQTTSASCCRVVVQGDGFVISRTNEPLCPFPAPTGDICVRTPDSTIAGGVTACAFAN